MSEVLDRDSKGTGKTEICQLEQAFSIDEQILGLQVAMKYFVPMALFNAIKKLVQVFLENIQQLDDDQ